MESRKKPFQQRQGPQGDKFIPGSEARPEEVFTFPFLLDDDTIKFINGHGRIMFILRGPPGTGKNTLSSMISEKYPQAVTCSADAYFSQRFVDKYRTRETLAQSHDFCAKRVQEECINGTHPIIVKNTHIRIREMNPYIEYAAKYGYTVIMAITLRKFFVDSQTLARTNRKGLTQDYFQRRMNQWEECTPFYIGWFLGVKDSSFLLGQAKTALSSLFSLDEFSDAMSVSTKNELFNYYGIADCLFCIASVCKSGCNYASKQFYLSQAVQNVYGKSFTLSIQGFIISKQYLLAVVAITQDMIGLMLKHPKEDDIVQALGNLHINPSLEGTFNKTLDEAFPSMGKTAEEIDFMADETMNINFMSFMIIGRRSGSQKLILEDDDMGRLAKDFFGELADSTGSIEEKHFNDLKNSNGKYCKLSGDTWLLQMPKKIQTDGLLTGLYHSSSRLFS